MNGTDPDIEDVYELSPLQEGMLIHTLCDTGVGMYVNHAVYTFDHVDVSALRNTWQHVVDRHTILRTSFHWENLDSPQQVVHRDVPITMATQDWRELSPWEQELHLRQFLHEDRHRGFDLAKPPLLRLSLFRRSQHSYYFVFSHHHLLLDGWSHPLLLAEVRAFYQAARKGQKLLLPPSRPYREYIAWLRSQDVDRAEAFWREYLCGITAPTPLPADLDTRRPNEFRLHFDEWSVRLPESLFTALQFAARKCRVTLTTLILGAWAMILSRYSGHRDVVFGLLVSGRPASLEGVESMIGMFLNTLPVRVRVDPYQPLREWLKHLQRQQSDLQQYEYSSLRMVQGWSDVPPGTPLFESVVDINNTPQQKAQATGTVYQDDRAQRVLSASIRQNFPLLLDGKIVASEFVMTLTYDVRRFTASSITQVAEQLRTLLAAMAEDLDPCLGDLPLMSPLERDRVILEWNQTRMSYPTDVCLHQLFENRAARTPETPAVRYLDQQLTYRELNQRANRLAHYLRTLGVRPGTPVGLCVERSIAMVTGLLGILKAGGAYVPLDPGYPLTRLTFMLRDAQADVLLTQENMLQHIGAFAGRTVCLDRDEGAWANQNAENPENVTDPEDLAYVLYTSGSTGTPKGVAAPHRVAVNRLHIEHDPFEPDEALCVKTSLSFVDSIWEMFSAWHNGLCATLVPEPHVRDPRLLVDTLAEAGATRIVLVPSLLRSLLDAGIDLAERLPRLKHWISSGEPLPADLCIEFAKHLPGAVLTNLYGTSEIWDATRCDARQRPPGEALPIGRPLRNVQAYVLDEQLRPVAIGVPGELYIGGHGLAHGYWRRPGLTAEKFIPNPFSQEAGQRLYKTGDRVRWLSDGNIEYLGRCDQQLKLRGFRIELEEIESVLRQHERIRQAVVTVTGDEQLAAYIVAEDGHAPKPGALREFVRSRLPEYMIPALYFTLEQLPLTPSGKVDRRALPALQEQVTVLANDAPSRPAETPTEKTIARVWADLLGVRTVGADSDFFELGGHSLMAARIASRLSTLLELEIPLGSLFEARTVAGLAAWIERAKENGGGDEAPAVPALMRAERGKLAPLSFAQQRMWFLDQLNPGSVSYTVRNVIHFTGSLNVDALRRALAEIVRRHESLRTTFITRDGEPFQLVHEPAEVGLPVMDLTTLPENEREHAARSHARQQAREPWNLLHGPLFRTHMYRLSPASHILALSMHHIITDGQSMGIFARELAILYRAFLKQRPSPLPELPLQYADFAIWQRDWLKGNELDKQLTYWEEKLSGAPALELPLDRPRPPVHRYRGARRTFHLSADLATPLQELAQEEGATLFMVLLAGFQLLLARYSGQEDICVGTPVANRNRAELEHLIGFFVNTLVLRTDLSGQPTFLQLLRRVKQACVEAYDHQDLPFDKLVDALHPQRDLSRHPLFQVMFVHQHAAGNAVQVPGISWQHRAAELETSNFDLLLVATETGAALECTLQYNSDLFEPRTIDRMGSHLRLLFEHVVADPDRPLPQIPLLSEDERRQVLIDWNSTRVRREEKRCIHELVEERALQAPERTAVRFEGQALSYAELDRRSNQLARRLQALGVGPEAIVGVCVERSPELIVGLLGTLKAGGAFLPLDPAYPRERLAYMLHDSGARTILIQQRLSNAVPTGSHPLICLDSDWESIAREDDRRLDYGATPHNVAYVIYTSGSTGTPKGVLVEHRGLANVICAQIPQFEIHPKSRVLQTLSISFDAAVGEIFRALAAGATLCLAPKEDLLPGPGLVNLLRDQRITTVTLSPTTLAALPAAGDELPELRTLTVGGEACAPELAARWGKDRRLINGYGPTETTIGATLAVNWDLERKPPLGRPLAHVEVYVLDRWMQPTPVGVPGALYIAGIGVARGYLNRPDLTAEKFVPNPFSTRPGARMYQTGDLVRWLPDGNLDFLGRIDQQVKIRGFRIELSEIESVLNQHPQVGQCVVNVWEERGIRRLAGYLTPRDNDVPSLSDVRAFLKTRLPDYMIPAFLTALPSLPLTANGKVDRQALPKPDAGQVNGDTAFVAPRSKTEKVLARIWADVLGLERVGIHSNFFELGGDSIMSIQVVARMTEAGWKVTPKDLFQHQTIAELAEVTETADRVEAGQNIISGEVPLTPVQCWFLDQNPVAPHHFNQWLSLHAPRLLDPGLLLQALQHLIEHHDALRSRFTNAGGSWQQHIAPPHDQAPFVHVDLSQVRADEQQHQVDAKLEALQASLDLSTGPLLRMAWFDLGSDRPGRLVLIIHHLVIDLVSWPILMEDLMTAYRQLEGGQPVRLPPKTTSFKRWAEALTEYAHSEVLENEAPYWLNLSDREAVRLPVDRTGGENTKKSAEAIVVHLDDEETQLLLRKAPEIYKIQIHDVLLTGVALVLSRWISSCRVLVNIEGHGREDIGAEVNLSRTIGWFTAFYPLWLEVEPGQELNEVLLSVRDQLRGVPNRGIGYSVLRYLSPDVALRKKLSSMPQAEIAFNYTGQQGGNPQPSGQPEPPKSPNLRQPNLSDGMSGQVRLSEPKQGSRRHLLEIAGSVVHGRLSMRWVYSSNIHHPDTIKQLADGVLNTLREIAIHTRRAETLTPTTLPTTDLIESQ